MLFIYLFSFTYNVVYLAFFVVRLNCRTYILYYFMFIDFFKRFLNYLISFFYYISIIRSKEKERLNFLFRFYNIGIKIRVLCVICFLFFIIYAYLQNIANFTSTVGFYCWLTINKRTSVIPAANIISLRVWKKIENCIQQIKKKLH